MPEDRNLRRTRDRLSGSLKIHLALREAVLNVAGVTEYDLQRITDQLGDGLNQFKHLERFDECRDAFVAWAVRQAQLTARLRTILSGVRFDSHVTTMLFMRLPEFTEGNGEFAVWVAGTVQREQEGVEALADWIAVHRRAVRFGIESVLCSCVDLGIGQPVIDELETQVWCDVAYNTNELLESKEPISRQLWWKGKWAARAWKSARLEEKTKLDAKLTVDIESVVRGEHHRGVAVDEVIDVDAILNPIIIRELPWTDAELKWELYHAGPFRADDRYEVLQQFAAA